MRKLFRVARMITPRYAVYNMLTALGILLFAFAAQAQLLGYQVTTLPANPTGTADATGKMMGLGAATNACLVIPQKTGVMMFVISFKAANGTAGDGYAAQLSYGTGTAPANAAAAAGTQVGVFQGSDNTATVQEAQTMIAVVRGLTLGSIYWYDLYLKAITGGTATLTNVACQAFELAGG